MRERPDAVGVLACKTGIGVSIAANKFGGVYAARCLSVADAEMARTINNANVLCLAVGSGAALNAAIVDAFMRTPYQGRKLDELAGLLRFERRTKDGARRGGRSRTCASNTSSRSASRRWRRAGSAACSRISTVRWWAITSTRSRAA